MIASTQATSAAVASDIHDYIRTVLPREKFIVVAGRMYTCDPRMESVVFWAKTADIWIIIFKLGLASVPGHTFGSTRVDGQINVESSPSWQ